MSLEKLANFFLLKDETPLSREELYECLRIMKENVECTEMPKKPFVQSTRLNRPHSYRKITKHNESALDKIFIRAPAVEHMAQADEVSNIELQPIVPPFFKFDIPNVSRYNHIHMVHE